MGTLARKRGFAVLIALLTASIVAGSPATPAAAHPAAGGWQQLPAGAAGVEPAAEFLPRRRRAGYNTV